MMGALTAVFERGGRTGGPGAELDSSLWAKSVFGVQLRSGWLFAAGIVGGVARGDGGDATCMMLACSFTGFVSPFTFTSTGQLQGP